MIELTNLIKRFGKKVAVDDVTLTIRPGVITGFVGPNGAGKSTTIRMILGLDRPTVGSVRDRRSPFASCRAPLRTVGALIDAHGAQSGRSAHNHLRVLATTNGIPRSRVDEVIELVGLTEVANQRVGSFSMGMGQRVGIAAALLGDPQTVILDEPVNGLDPEGIHYPARRRRLEVVGVSAPQIGDLAGSSGCTCTSSVRSRAHWRTRSWP